MYTAQVSDLFVESVRSSIPPLPEEIESRLTRDHGIKPADSRWIANDSAAFLRSHARKFKHMQPAAAPDSSCTAATRQLPIPMLQLLIIF